MLEQSLLILIVGLIFGFEHAIEIDHVAAVTTLTAQAKSILQAAFLGAVWGLGHTVTLFVFGAIILLSKVVIQEQVSLTLEFLVGVLLVVLGLDVIRRVRNGSHTHSHEHDHHHDSEPRQLLRSFGVGLMHGLAGTAAVILLIVTAIPSTGLALLFLITFGIGLMIGMSLLSIALKVPSRFFTNSARFQHGFMLVAGIVSIIIGLNIMYTIGFVEAVAL